MTGLTSSCLSTMKILEKVSSFWKLIALVLPFIFNFGSPPNSLPFSQNPVWQSGSRFVVEVKRKDPYGLTVCFLGQNTMMTPA